MILDNIQVELKDKAVVDDSLMGVDVTYISYLDNMIEFTIHKTNVNNDIRGANCNI